MTDYISRADAIDAVVNMQDGSGQTYEFVREAMFALNALPSADAVHGEWIRVGHDIYECSLCHQNVMTKDIDCYSFCHRCGARMKGGDDE